MTHEEIMAMEAGRELDALVAEKVMGRDPLNARHGLRNSINGEYELSYYWGYPQGHDFAPFYSTYIAAAQQVHLFMLSQESRIKALYLHALADVLTDKYPGPPSVWTAPLECFDEDTICRAALLATMEDLPTHTREGERG